jgi:hypothetical protein
MQYLLRRTSQPVTSAKKNRADPGLPIGGCFMRMRSIRCRPVCRAGFSETKRTSIKIMCSDRRN